MHHHVTREVVDLIDNESLDPNTTYTIQNLGNFPIYYSPYGVNLAKETLRVIPPAETVIIVPKEGLSLWSNSPLVSCEIDITLSEYLEDQLETFIADHLAVMDTKTPVIGAVNGAYDDPSEYVIPDYSGVNLSRAYEIPESFHPVYIEVLLDDSNGNKIQVTGLSGGAGVGYLSFPVAGKYVLDWDEHDDLFIYSLKYNIKWHVDEGVTRTINAEEGLLNFS